MTEIKKFYEVTSYYVIHGEYFNRNTTDRETWCPIEYIDYSYTTQAKHRVIRSMLFETKEKAYEKLLSLIDERISSLELIKKNIIDNI